MCVSMWRRRKEGFKGGDGTDSLTTPAPSCFSFPFFRTWLLRCNRGWKHLRRMWQQLPFLLPSFLWYSVTRQMLHSNPPPFSPSFVILISESHVAPPASSGCESCESRICRSSRQHTMTDPIAERRKPTQPQCKNPFAETCNVVIWVRDVPQTFDPTVHNIQDLWG